jgi:hypothetical protein
VEGEFAVLRDVEIRNGCVPVYHGTWVNEAEVVCVSRKDGKALCAKLDRRKRTYTGPLTEGEYVANMAPIGGSRAVYPLMSSMRYSVILGSEDRACLLVSVDVGKPRLAKGDTIRYKYLAVWSTVNAPPDNGFIEEVCEKLGLRGRTAYRVEPQHGSVLDTSFALRLQAENGGFAGKITQASLPMGLPVFVAGLNSRWPAGILYKGRNQLLVPTWKMDKVASRHAEQVKVAGENQLLRFAILNGTGMLQVDTECGDRDVYIGNLLVCDQPDVFLSLDDVRPGKVVMTANNPTDKELTCTICPGPGFNLLGDFAKTVTLPAGGLVRLSPK